MSKISAIPSPPGATNRQWWGLLILLLPTMLLSLDLTVLYLAVPNISAELHPSGADLLWILDIYGFLLAGFLIVMGALGDRFGRRRLLLLGGFGFALASIFAANASSAGMLIFARALLGITAATLMPSTLALIRNMFVLRHQRARAITIWTAGFAVGGALGPLVGGLMLEHYHWGSVFLLGVPVMLLLLLFGPFLLPEYRDENPSPIDFGSTLLSIAVVLLIIYGIKEIAHEQFSGKAVFFIAAGLFLGVFFILRQRRLPHPLIDLSLFANPVFTVSIIAMLLILIAWSSFWFMIFLYFQGIKGMTPLQAGIVMLPPPMLQILAALLLPQMLRHVQLTHLICSGLLLAALGFSTMLAPTNEVWLFVCGAAMIKVGILPMLAMGTNMVIGTAPPAKTGSAAAISETSAEIGVALGISLIGSVTAFIYRSHMLRGELLGIPPDLARMASDNFGSALAVIAQLPQTLAAPLLLQAQEAFNHALQANGLIGIVLLLVAAAVVARWLPRESSEQAQEAEH